MLVIYSFESTLVFRLQPRSGTENESVPVLRGFYFGLTFRYGLRGDMAHMKTPPNRPIKMAQMPLARPGRIPANGTQVCMDPSYGANMNKEERKQKEEGAQITDHRI